MSEFPSMEELNSYLSKLELYYRPPGGDYMKITEYLDNVEERLRKLEDATDRNTTDE